MSEQPGKETLCESQITTSFQPILNAGKHLLKTWLSYQKVTATCCKSGF